MKFGIRHHNRWRRRFALFPVKIAHDRLLWLEWYEWRWKNEYSVKFERRAIVDGAEFIFLDEIPYD